MHPDFVLQGYVFNKGADMSFTFDKVVLSLPLPKVPEADTYLKWGYVKQDFFYQDIEAISA